MPNLTRSSAQQHFYPLTEIQVGTVLSQHSSEVRENKQRVRPLACGVTLSHLQVLSCSSARVNQKDLFFGRMWSYSGYLKRKKGNHGLIQSNRFTKPKLYLQFYNVSLPFRNVLHFQTPFH